MQLRDLIDSDNVSGTFNLTFLLCDFRLSRLFVYFVSFLPFNIDSRIYDFPFIILSFMMRW